MILVIHIRRQQIHYYYYYYFRFIINNKESANFGIKHDDTTDIEMNHLIILLSFAHCLLTFCGFNQTEILKAESSTSDRLINNQYSLFILEMIISDNFVRITPPNQSDFELPDKLAKTEPYGNEDFNADGKEDVLVYLGACGTGRFMYGLFLKQIDNYYKLAFMDYLKNPEFKVEKNGF
jgi:hypothetical protein